ncbi:cysteine methyltransferase [Siphonobacter sp. BAB-5385]|uniref:bifunctional transcriptional activator/DNA repair enzyme AdaA n=1 Tax=Siphonobacter sp. BAB-5385 TaxID=1864822 RepID=UPI000B9DED03|nr:methylated-DNA--[protein]-cysteine S-methyltransferase [Siphonobacter sp. BAB-5385]OZI05165.1 cysteine methyltransferase [Siphonobacter sp. BAB-5385]
MNDYQRIEKAIQYLNTHFQQQPSLDAVAEHVHLSPYHFQRLFKDWAGVSPKKFLQYISLEHAKSLLAQGHSLADTSFETGLSSTSRLHDLFVTIEGMTPGEYKNGGQYLQIQYSFGSTPFGPICMASTEKGVCHVAFITSEEEGKATLQLRFPHAQLELLPTGFHRAVLLRFEASPTNLPQLKLHLKGTDFQLKVWQALLQIPPGRLSTYAGISQAIEQPSACRAVGTAIGQNPIAYLIPCHRVIRSTGLIGDYHWGASRKAALIGWESAHILGEPENVC